MGDVVDLNQVTGAHHQLVQTNLQLMRQLSISGIQPDKTLFIQCAVETLIEILFADRESLEQYNLAVEINISEKLQQLLAHASHLDMD